jgi:hypothetical protein
MATRILEECDYTLEARRQREFARLFAGRSDLRVPAVVDELSSARVLTSELVRGDPFDVFAARASAEARTCTGIALLDFYVEATFRHERYNTDPNQGNFLFADDHVTFLDFGRVKELSPGFAGKLRRLLRAAFERDRPATRAALLDLGAVPDPARYDFGHTFRGMLLLNRSSLTDEPFTYTPAHMRKVWRTFVGDNPNLARTHFTADMAFLHQFHFGVTALLARLGARLSYRAKMLDLLYEPGEKRPPPFSDSELALLNL